MHRRMTLSIDAYTRNASIRIDGNTNMGNGLVGILHLIHGTLKDVLRVRRHASARNQREPFRRTGFLRVVASFQHGAFWKITPEMLRVDNDTGHTFARLLSKLEHSPVRQRNVEQRASFLHHENAGSIGMSCRLPSFEQQQEENV